MLLTLPPPSRTRRIGSGGVSSGGGGGGGADRFGGCVRLPKVSVEARRDLFFSFFFSLLVLVRLVCSSPSFVMYVLPGATRSTRGVFFCLLESGHKHVRSLRAPKQGIGQAEPDPCCQHRSTHALAPLLNKEEGIKKDTCSPDLSSAVRLTAAPLLPVTAWAVAPAAAATSPGS